MDCSLREASRKEQSIAPKNAFFGPIRVRKGVFPCQKVSFSCYKEA